MLFGTSKPITDSIVLLIAASNLFLFGLSTMEKGCKSSHIHTAKHLVICSAVDFCSHEGEDVAPIVVIYIGRAFSEGICSDPLLFVQRRQLRTRFIFRDKQPPTSLPDLIMNYIVDSPCRLLSLCALCFLPCAFRWTLLFCFSW